MNAGKELCSDCHIAKALWLSVMAIMVYTWGNRGTLSQIPTWLGDASGDLGLSVEFRQTCPLSLCASPAAQVLLLTHLGSLCGAMGARLCGHRQTGSSVSHPWSCFLVVRFTQPLSLLSAPCLCHGPVHTLGYGVTAGNSPSQTSSFSLL